MNRRMMLAGFAATQLAACSRPAATGDQYYLDLYARWSRDLNEVVDRIYEDPKIVSIDRTGSSYATNPANIDRDRSAAIFGVLSKIGCQNVGVFGDKHHGSVEFILSARGISVSGSAVSLTYSTIPMDGQLVQNVVQSMTENEAGFRVFYRPIEAEWFLVGKS